MRGSNRKHKLEEEDIRQFLLEGAEEETIPESLQPEQMEKWLRQQCRTEEEPVGLNSEMQEGDREPAEGQSSVIQGSKKGKYIGWWCGTFAAAACLALVLFAAGRNMDWGIGGDTEKPMDEMEAFDGTAEEQESKEGTTYAQLYQSFDRYWKEQEELYRKEIAYNEIAEEEAVDEEMPLAEAAAPAEVAVPTDTAAPADAMNGSDDMKSEAEMGQTEGSEDDYGKTNRQEEAVEEADIIKNDGRYLYRVVYGNNYGIVRIVDTEGGLKEASRVGNFESVQNIYVWEDKLVVIEPRWADTYGVEEDDSIWTSGYSYCRIYVYDISDRTNPQEYHTFTVKGSYMDSRISDGYLYFFTSCDTDKPGSVEDLKKYVPMMDGEPMAEEKITLPGGSKAASYLVMASVDMEHPDTFVDTRALVTTADKFYVSQSNIYVADAQYISYEKEGSETDSTILYRYSYKDGKMRKEAEGRVKGRLRDDLAMNEYQGYLRLVTTVESREVSKIIDDISGEFLGYDGSDYHMTNSLYVLDPDLNTVGKIEELAPDERVYSARFMGNTGYFVTFRETDPLFSVDLSNPREPKILGELKISGFSEYLHFYADNLLLGIGMEADENTGVTDCLKISMFDISNPSDVKEKSKMELSKYEYSEALYNYKAVLIDTGKNLFGFAVDDYDAGGEGYILFTFENGEFRKIMEIDCSDEERYGWNLRGTYIGDRFFLLAEKGLVEEFSLTDGSKTAVLEP